MLKRTVSVFLLASIILGCFAPAAEAYDGIKSAGSGTMQSHTEIVYIEDEDGKVIPVEVEETIFIPSSGEYSTMDISPRETIGKVKTISTKISNIDMGLAAIAGKPLTAAARKIAAKTASKVVAKKIGSHLIPGINILSFILESASLINAKTGHSGIKVEVTSKYVEHYLHKEGHYIYGWKLTRVKVKQY